MNETLWWLGVWSMLLCGVGMLRKDILCHTWSKLLFFPGVVLEAGLRSIVCLATLTPIVRVSPCGEGKPVIETGESRLGALAVAGSVFLHAFLLVVLALCAIGYFPEFTGSGFALPYLAEPSLDAAPAPHALRHFASQVTALPALLDLGSLRGFLFAYTLVGCLIAAGFARREGIGAIAVWLSLYACFVAIDWLGLRFGFLSRGWFIRVFYAEVIWSAFSLLVLGTFFSLAVLLAYRTSSAIFGAPPSRPTTKRGKK